MRTLTSAGYFETEYIIAVYVHQTHTQTRARMHARTVLKKNYDGKNLLAIGLNICCVWYEGFRNEALQWLGPVVLEKCARHCADVL